MFCNNDLTFWLDELKTELLLFYDHVESFASHDRPGDEWDGWD